jgi:hypothetical protein
MLGGDNAARLVASLPILLIVISVPPIIRVCAPLSLSKPPFMAKLIGMLLISIAVIVILAFGFAFFQVAGRLQTMTLSTVGFALGLIFIAEGLLLFCGRLFGIKMHGF